MTARKVAVKWLSFIPIIHMKTQNGFVPSQAENARKRNSTIFVGPPLLSLLRLLEASQLYQHSHKFVIPTQQKTLRNNIILSIFSTTSSTMMMQRSSIVALLGSILLLSSTNEGASARMMEEDRRLQYEKRGYKWPIKAFNPNTEGWNALMNDRLNQVSEIDDETERYKGYVTTLFPALVVSNLTEYGWAMTRISDDLLMQLQQGIKDGFNDKQEEGRTPIIEGNQAWWIERDDLMDLVEEELHAPLEEWCGTDLVSHNNEVSC